MKLLYVSSGYTPHDRRFLKAFAENNYDTFFLRTGELISETRPVPEGIVEISIQRQKSSNDNWTELELPARLAVVIEQIDPDIVLAGPIQNVSYPVALAGCNSLISMSWGSDILLEAGRNGETVEKTKYALTKSRGFLCDCDSVRNKALSFAPFLKDWNACFPWGLDLEEMISSHPSDLRSYLGWENKTVFISTRSFEPVYSIETLIHSFAVVICKYPECRLILIGTGSRKDSIIKLINKLSLDSYVKIAGRMSATELGKYYSAADVYVSTALSDGTSVSLLEAMYHGLPVIVSNCPGNREWVENGINGWLAAPGNCSSFKEAMLTACSQREIWLSMADINRSKVFMRADWNRNIKLLFDLFQKIVREKIKV